MARELPETMSPLQIQRLLDQLCGRLGFCLPPEDQLRLRENPPEDARSFNDAVFVAEGLDPETADRHLYRLVRDLVARAFWLAGEDLSG